MDFLREKIPSRFSEYRPYPAIDARDEWESIPQEYRAFLVQEGEKYLGQKPEIFTATDWLAYSRTGNRTDFEGKYFARRRALCALVLSECCEDRGRFLEDIQNVLYLICEESGWQLPAHNTYVRDTPSLSLPDVTRPVLDLFACETGALLAMCLYLLQDRLVLMKERMVFEMKNRIIQPYMDNWFWWMGGRGEATNNWTVWCSQNILLSAFLIELDPLILHQIVMKSIDSIDAFLSDYGEDGCCDEGAAYYRHAGLCLFGALDVLHAITSGAINMVWQLPKIRNIAHYILDVHVDDQYYFNFADCSPIAGRAGVREFLFGKRCGDDALCEFAAAEWSRDKDHTKAEDINLFYRVQSAFTVAEITAYSYPDSIFHREMYYPSTGLFIARDNMYSLAIKAGDNDDGHNHNDTGSVILYKNGRPFLIDIGVENYTEKTFSPRRYEIWVMQSSWHNLAEFDGVQQCVGADFRATDIDMTFTPEFSRISMQLCNAWPERSGVKSYLREVVLKKGNSVTVHDQCDGSFKDAVLNLIFCVEPHVDAHRITLVGLGAVALEGDRSIEVEKVRITDAKLLKAWPSVIYRVRIHFDHSIHTMMI